MSGMLDAVVAAKTRQLFGDRAEDALELLGNEIARVQLGMLKNSEGDLERLAAQAELAQVDYRDVLAAAEYPRQMRRLHRPTSPEDIAADRAEYEAWLADDRCS